MHKIMLSYPLFGEGMKRLESETSLFVSNSGDLMPFVDRLRECDAFITRNVHPTTEQLKTCPNLKIIGIPGVGYQSFDIDFLNAQGIAIVFCPGMNLRSVAEHAVAMAYALCKNIPEDSDEVKRGNYAVRNRFNNIELLGKTVGVAGFGAIGRETARLFAAHDMNIAVYDPYVARDAVEKLGYSLYDRLDDMLAVSDILTLHMPSLPETDGMFGEKQFDSMKDGVRIVNCARGSVIDEDALLNALNNKKVAGAALDVMRKEPFDVDSPLAKLPNVILTPHVGGVTAEAAERTHKLCVDSTLALLDGEQITNVANPEALNHKRWSFLNKDC